MSNPPGHVGPDCVKPSFQTLEIQHQLQHFQRVCKNFVLSHFICITIKFISFGQVQFKRIQGQIDVQTSLAKSHKLEKQAAQCEIQRLKDWARLQENPDDRTVEFQNDDMTRVTLPVKDFYTHLNEEINQLKRTIQKQAPTDALIQGKENELAAQHDMLKIRLDKIIADAKDQFDLNRKSIETLETEVRACKHESTSLSKQVAMKNNNCYQDFDEADLQSKNLCRSQSAVSLTDAPKSLQVSYGSSLHGSYTHQEQQAVWREIEKLKQLVGKQQNPQGITIIVVLPIDDFCRHLNTEINNLKQSLREIRGQVISQNSARELRDQYELLKSQINEVKDEVKLQLLDKQESTPQNMLQKQELCYQKVHDFDRKLEAFRNDCHTTNQSELEKLKEWVRSECISNDTLITYDSTQVAIPRQDFYMHLNAEINNLKTRVGERQHQEISFLQTRVGEVEGKIDLLHENNLALTELIEDTKQGFVNIRSEIRGVNESIEATRIDNGSCSLNINILHKLGEVHKDKLCEIEKELKLCQNDLKRCWTSEFNLNDPKNRSALRMPQRQSTGDSEILSRNIVSAQPHRDPRLESQQNLPGNGHEELTHSGLPVIDLISDSDSITPPKINVEAPVPRYTSDIDLEMEFRPKGNTHRATIPMRSEYPRTPKLRTWREPVSSARRDLVSADDSSDSDPDDRRPPKTRFHLNGNEGARKSHRPFLTSSAAFQQESMPDRARQVDPNLDPKLNETAPIILSNPKGKGEAKTHQRSPGNPKTSRCTSLNQTYTAKGKGREIPHQSSSQHPSRFGSRNRTYDTPMESDCEDDLNNPGDQQRRYPNGGRPLGQASCESSTIPSQFNPAPRNNSSTAPPNRRKWISGEKIHHLPAPREPSRRQQQSEMNPIEKDYQQQLVKAIHSHVRFLTNTKRSKGDTIACPSPEELDNFPDLQDDFSLPLPHEAPALLHESEVQINFKKPKSGKNDPSEGRQQFKKYCLRRAQQYGLCKVALVSSENPDDWGFHDWNVRTCHFVVDTFIHATIAHQYPEVDGLGVAHRELVESLVTVHLRYQVEKIVRLVKDPASVEQKKVQDRRYHRREALAARRLEACRANPETLGCFQFLFEDATLCSSDESSDDIRDETRVRKVPEWRSELATALVDRIDEEYYKLRQNERPKRAGRKPAMRKTGENDLPEPSSQWPVGLPVDCYVKPERFDQQQRAKLRVSPITILENCIKLWRNK
ncbi:hypothetical protein MJO29_003142 [Puccinia striiformis f. sp. tritici]|nr:hypothetical protein MJO29_003142 [Puccinia striiformis f. sp. tritici]